MTPCSVRLERQGGAPFRYPLSPILPQSWKGLPSPPTTAARHSQPERGRCFDCPFHSTMVMRAYFRFCQVFDRRTCSFLSKLPFKASETSEYSRFGKHSCFAVCGWCASFCRAGVLVTGGLVFYKPPVFSAAADLQTVSFRHLINSPAGCLVNLFQL